MLAKGMLRHGFFGDYQFTLVLSFDCAPDAAAAEARLLGFTQLAAGLRTLYLHGDTTVLEFVKSFLEDHRVDDPCALFDCKRKSAARRERHPIDSCAHSIDYGPEFTINLPIPIPEQEVLFRAMVEGRRS
jgi:hypothetical protein